MNVMKLFAWFNNPQRDLEAEMVENHRTLAACTAKCNELAEHNTQLQQRVNYLETLEKDLTRRETSIQSYAVDFKLLNVFSIERQTDDKGNPYTTLGWMSQNHVSHEWYLYCNQSAHEELVKQFTLHLSVKAALPPTTD